MKARAVAKYIKGSPQKARLVIDLIRGRNVNEALAILKGTNKRAVTPIETTLRSAIIGNCAMSGATSFPSAELPWTMSRLKAREAGSTASPMSAATHSSMR